MLIFPTIQDTVLAFASAFGITRVLVPGQQPAARYDGVVVAVEEALRPPAPVRFHTLFDLASPWVVNEWARVSSRLQ